MDDRPGSRRRPAFERLGAHALLSQVLHPVDENGRVLPPQVLADAYHEVQASQFATLRSLGDSYRQVEAAYAGFRREVPAGPILVQGTADVHRVLKALRVAASVERSTIDTAESSIANGLFTNVQTIVETATTGGASLARKGLEQADATVGRLDALGGEPAAAAVRD
jgi:hypothetical protein